MEAKRDEKPTGSNGSCMCEEGSCICCICDPENNQDQEAAFRVCKCSGTPQKTDQITAVLSTRNNLVMVQPTVKPKAEIVLTTMDYNNRRNSFTKDRNTSTSSTSRLSSKSDYKSKSAAPSKLKAEKPTKPPPEKIEENGVVGDQKMSKKNVGVLTKNDSGEDKRNCCVRFCSKLKCRKSPNKKSKSAKPSESVKEVKAARSTKSKSETKPTKNAVEPNDNFSQTDPIKTENAPVQASSRTKSQTEPPAAMAENRQEYSSIQAQGMMAQGMMNQDMMTQGMMAQGNICTCLCRNCGGPVNTNAIVIPRDVPSNLNGYKNNGGNGENLENLRNSIKNEAKVTKRGIEEILTQLDKQRRDVRELREMFNVFLKLSREVFVMQALGVGDGPFSSKLSKSYSPSPYKKSSDDELSESSFWNRKRSSQEEKTRSQGLQAAPTREANCATSDPKDATSEISEKTAEKGVTTEKKKNCTLFNWCRK